MLRGPSSRGSSALAALVLVVIVGFVALAVSSLSGEGKVAFVADSSAQLAQTAASTATKEPEVSLKGAIRCKAPIEQKKGSESDPIGGGDQVKNVCVPGCIYEISKTKTSNEVASQDTCASLPSSTAAERTLKTNCEKSRACVVKHCTAPGNCTVVASADREKELGRAASIPEYYKSEKEILDALNKARQGQDVTADIGKLSPTMQSAFAEAQSDEQARIDAETLANKAKIESNKQFIEDIAASGQAGSSPQGTDALVQQYQDENAALAAKNAELEKTKQNLSKTNLNALKDNASVTTPGESPSGPQYDAFGNVCGSAGADPNTCSISRQQAVYRDAFGNECGKPGADSKTCPGGATFNQRPPSGPPPPADPREQGGGGFGAGLGKVAQSLLGSLAKAFGGGAAGAGGQACSSDPNAYAQQQQQYNLQLQQYNLQLQQYNQQQHYGGIGGYGAPTPPVPPQPCTPSTQSQCQSQPQQPPASSCTSGSWKPVQNGACVSSWQCVPSGAAGDPTAQLSCQPKVADVGMSIAISYACGNATGSSATGFTTNSALSGSAQATTTLPSAGTNTNVFTLTCANQARTASAQCTVQIAKPSIVLVANPKEVKSGEASTIGWITSGMKSCIVSSPDQSDFTARNAANTSVNGMATTSPVTLSTRILLNCETYGGDTREASTTVSVITS